MLLAEACVCAILFLFFLSYSSFSQSCSNERCLCKNGGKSAYRAKQRSASRGVHIGAAVKAHTHRCFFNCELFSEWQSVVSRKRKEGRKGERQSLFVFLSLSPSFCVHNAARGSFQIIERIACYMLFAPLHVFLLSLSPSLGTKCRESRRRGICLADSLSVATRQRCSLT
uniref:Secreted protein n=1 Tax=Wuchereria bancrofti TaxID=6293 RepID=A0A1I8E914_WUCBA